MAEAPIYRVIRDVDLLEEGNYSGYDIFEGDILYGCTQYTYGCVNTLEGIALTFDETGDYPFFQFPLDAVERVPDGTGNVVDEEADEES